MANPTLDFLFKLPQISTRSQAKLNFVKVSESRKNKDVNKSKKPQILPEIVDKRVTRSTGKCLTTNKPMPTFRSKLKKDKTSRAMSLESGYVSNESKDCDSVGSRESGISDLLKNCESPEERYSDFGPSPPNFKKYCKSSGVPKIVSLRRGNIMALIPENNVYGSQGPFKLSVENGHELTR